VAVLRQRPHTRAELRELSGFGARKLTQMVTLLEETGSVVEDGDGKLRCPDGAPVPVEAARRALVEVERHQILARSRIDMMLQFAEDGGCRGRAILAYFGDRLDGPCGHCDNCAGVSSVEPEPEAVAGEPFAVHSAVRHAVWGPGTVLGYTDGRMTVLFEQAGYKTLSVAVVLKGGLLSPA
jgi:ATP-dependent DNA helicase RecQ